MTVEIVQRGIKPSEKKYVGQCRACHTIIRCTGSDITVHSNQRDVDYQTVPCPVCEESIFVKPEKDDVGSTQWDR